MIPSKLTVGVMNDLETKPLTNTEKCKLRWGRLMAQQDKLPECKSRNDVMKLIGLDPSDFRDQRKGSSWVNQLIAGGALEEVRTPHSFNQSSYRIVGVPNKVKGRRPNKKKRAKKVVEKKVVEKPVEQPVAKPIAKPIEQPIEQPVVEKVAEKKEVYITIKRRKPITIGLEFTGVEGSVVAETLATLISKINKI